MGLNQGISDIIKSRCMNFSDFLQQVKDLKSMQVIFLRIASFFNFWVKKDPNGPKIMYYQWSMHGNFLIFLQKVTVSQRPERESGLVS